MAVAAPARPAGMALARLATVAVVAVLLASVVLPWRPATLCTLRALTGIPCPFCGATTALVELGRVDLVAALRASPLAVLGVVLAVGQPLLRDRLARVPRRARLLALAAALVVSQLWQLARFGLL